MRVILCQNQKVVFSPVHATLKAALLVRRLVRQSIVGPLVRWSLLARSTQLMAIGLVPLRFSLQNPFKRSL